MFATSVAIALSFALAREAPQNAPPADVFAPPAAAVGTAAPAADAPSPPAAPSAAASPAPADLDALLVPPRNGLDGWVVLASGGVRRGRVTAVDANSVTVRVDAERSLILRADIVRGVLPLSALGDDRVPYGSLRGRPGARVLLDDGRRVEGAVVERAADHLVLDGAGGPRRVETARVVALVPLREGPRPIEPQPRHLEAPSAFLLRSGELHVASVEGAQVMAVYGILDHLSVSVGSALPVLYAHAFDTNLQAALRGGLELHPLLHVAAGAHLSAAAGRTTVFLSATATIGVPALHLTVHAGPTFPGASELGDFGDVGVAVAATARTPWGFDAIGETWVSHGLDRTDTLVALAGRFRAGRAALDLGAATVASRGELLPWIGITVDATP